MALAEDSLNMYRAATMETTLVSEIHNTIKKKNVTIATGQGKTPFSIFCDKFCDRKHLLIFFVPVNLAIMYLKIFQ